MKIEVGQVWSFNNQAELDWLKRKFKEDGMEFGKEGWGYQSFLGNSFLGGEEGSFVRAEEDGTGFCSREWYEQKGYTILEVADYMEVNQMFKVGDRVKVVGNSYWAKYDSGEGEVKHLKNNCVYVNSDKHPMSIFAYAYSDLEIINQPMWKEVEREPKLGSRNDTLIVEQNTDTKELRLTTGCFTGTLDEFEAAVQRKPFGNKHRYDYEFYIERYKIKYPDYKKEVRYVVKLNDKIYYNKKMEITLDKNKAHKYKDIQVAELAVCQLGGTIEEIKV